MIPLSPHFFQLRMELLTNYIKNGVKIKDLSSIEEVCVFMLSKVILCKEFYSYCSHVKKLF